MQDPRQWWSGLAPLALLWAALAMTLTPGLEADLAARARSAVALDSIHEAQIDVSGRDVSIHGQAFHGDDAGGSRGAVEGVDGVRLVRDLVQPLGSRAPWVWTLQRQGDIVTLSGFVPDPVARRAIAARVAAAAPGAAIADETVYARGAPEGLADHAGFAATQAAGLASGRARLDGASLSLTGAAKSLDAYDAILTALKRPPFGLDIGVVAIDPPSAPAWIWSAAHEASGVALDGFAPPDMAIRLAEAARAVMPGRAVMDRTRPASGGPAGFREAALFALSALAKLEDGRVWLSDKGFSVSGLALPGVDPARLTERMPDGLALLSNNVRPAPPPVTFRAVRAEGRLALSGVYADDAMRDAILDLVRRYFPDDVVAIDMKAQVGAPIGFRPGVLAALSALARLKTGEASVSPDEISLSGEALNQVAAEDIAALAAPDGYRLTRAISIQAVAQTLTPPECQLALMADAGRGRLQFQTGRSDLAPESQAILDRLAATLLRCPEASVEISGHTDSSGSAEANLALSERRAAAMADALARAGVERRRLASRGYGGAQPLVPNDTEERRAQNRRIEFLLK